MEPWFYSFEIKFSLNVDLFDFFWIQMIPCEQLISISLAFSCSKWRRLSDDSPLFGMTHYLMKVFPPSFTHRVEDFDLFNFSIFFFNFFRFFFCFQCFIRSLINRIDRVPRSTCYWQLYCCTNMTHYSDTESLLSFSTRVQGSTDRNPLVRAVRSWSGTKFSRKI